MAGPSSIEWTERTWNPVVGCSIVSPGCTHCYAMRMAARIEAMGTAPHYAGLTRKVNGHPVWTGVMRPAPDAILTAPLRWKKPARIFVNSMSDLFAAPRELIDRAFAVMALTPKNTYQVLTKRSAEMLAYMTEPGLVGRICDAADAIAESMPKGQFQSVRLGDIVETAAWAFRHNVNDGLRLWPLENVWLGVSAEDQKRWNERVWSLLATPAAIRFVSVEPMLGPIEPTSIDDGDFERLPLAGTVGCQGEDGAPLPDMRPLDMIIVGGESGPGARPMHADWARTIRDTCAAASIAFFFKQWGEWLPGAQFTKALGEQDSDPVFSRFDNRDWIDERWSDTDELDLTGDEVYRVGKKAAGRLLDGVEHNALPERP